MLELLQILLGMAGVAALLWLFVRLGVFLDDLGLPRRRRVPKVEIQTLFHGNTKDEDQI
jgi:hypothetical protein